METSNHNVHDQDLVSIYDRLTNSSVLKMVVIFFLTSFMLIPMSWIYDLIQERRQREESVTKEIAQKWGRAQVVSAPVLAIPYSYWEETLQKDAEGKSASVKTLAHDWIFMLPEKSDIKVSVTPETLNRGIYQSVVYTAKVSIKGNFNKPDLSALRIDGNTVDWKNARIIFGVEDIKGLSLSPSLYFAGNHYTLKKDNSIQGVFPNMLEAAPIGLGEDDKVASTFELNYEIKGSKSFNFLPLADQTKLMVEGSWSNPSFNGGFLPDDRKVGQEGFQAVWNIASFGRKLPQQWIGLQRIYNFADIPLSREDMIMTSEELSNPASQSSVATDTDMVQVNFLPEVNNYQKTYRVAKYGILVIVLTFASLFFTEIIKKQRIHILQYILIGIAMVVFYSLLLAISEHLGFNIAYLIASIATVSLIASFILMITQQKKTALLFGMILSLFYVFIYVLMQLRDYSLIVGSIGIFIILAVLMKLSTKVNWYTFDRQ